MQTLTKLELKLEEARLICGATKRNLRRNWRAKFVLPEYFLFFEGRLSHLVTLIDETLGLIATSERLLQRSELLGQRLMDDGLNVRQINLIQTFSNQTEIARELSDLWHDEQEIMIEVQENLADFNLVARELENVRDEVGPKWWMDRLKFPELENLPQIISTTLIKELLDPNIQLPQRHTVIKEPPKRMARPYSPEPAWPPQKSNPRR